MNGIERVASLRVLIRARDQAAAVQVFLRGAEGLTGTGFASTVLDLGTKSARRLVLSIPLRRTAPYPLVAGDALEFFFEVDGVGYAFPGTVRERVQYPLNDQRTVSAVLLDFPPDLLKVQRRAHFRAPAPPAQPVPVRLRIVTEEESAEDRLFATDYPYAGHMQNISGSGMSMAMHEPREWEPPIHTVVTVTFRLTPQDANAIVLDARVCGITEGDGGAAAGTVLHIAWVNCTEDDEVTGAFARRIFRYVADRQQTVARERGERRRPR